MAAVGMYVGLTNYLLRRSRETARENAKAPEDRPALDGVSGGGQIVCRCCGLRITSSAQRIEVNGSHEYTFTNPGGIVFHIGCFARVQGCRFPGEPTSEWSWFSGYAWSVAICSGCGSHLGWRYSAGDDVFYGLILRRLTSMV